MERTEGFNMGGIRLYRAKKLFRFGVKHFEPLLIVSNLFYVIIYVIIFYYNYEEGG
ncbi:hypothetical protein [Caldicellulosiruptor acetigenus]|uniref:hypothetical protein n=1 Tax=Caldicellulosiruptor acetigenus TaxID=301953 RepID=UPI003A5C2ECC